MHRLLRPGGRLVIESGTVAESLLVGGIAPRSEVEFGGIRMTRRTATARPRAGWRPTTCSRDEDGNVERSRAAHHVHTAGEVVRMLEGAGFGAVRLVGGTARPYELGSPRLIAVAAAKRARAAEGIPRGGATAAPQRAPGSRSGRRR